MIFLMCTYLFCNARVLGGAHHGVGFARRGLPVGKDGGVEAGHGRLDDGGHCVKVHGPVTLHWGKHPEKEVNIYIYIPF